MNYYKNSTTILKNRMNHIKQLLIKKRFFMNRYLTYFSFFSCFGLGISSFESKLAISLSPRNDIILL